MIGVANMPQEIKSSHVNTVYLLHVSAPGFVGNRAPLLISLSAQLITYSTYSGPEQLVDGAARNSEAAEGA